MREVLPPAWPGSSTRSPPAAAERQVTEGTLKNTADRMSVALEDFTEALAVCDEDYRVDFELRRRRHRARD